MMRLTLSSLNSLASDRIARKAIGRKPTTQRNRDDRAVWIHTAGCHVAFPFIPITVSR